MFIGREAELKFLNDKYEENGGQLIVLYGRRRVGKTETLREFCKGKPHVFFSCTQTTDPVQLRNFSIRMMKEDIPKYREERKRKKLMNDDGKSFGMRRDVDVENMGFDSMISRGNMIGDKPNEK